MDNEIGGVVLVFLLSGIWTVESKSGQEMGVRVRPWPREK